jgi:flagellar hook-associated protein 3 FlgL
MNSLTVGSALSVQAQYVQAETQESSGLIASDFATLGGAASSEMLNLEDGIAQSQTWASDATTVGSATQSMYTALGNMATTLGTLETTISGAASEADTSTLYSSAQEIQNTLVTEMNTQQAGSYVFAGTNTGEAPVSLSSYQTSSYYGGSGTGTCYNYYTGNSDIQSVRVSAQQTVDYGVTANNAGFEEALRASQLVMDAASGTVTSGTLTSADPTATSTVTAGTLTINGASVTVTAGESLNAIATAINGVSASATSAISAKVVYTGSAYKLQISSGSTSSALTVSDGTNLGLASTTYATSLQANLKSALGVATSAVTNIADTQEAVAAKSSALSSAEEQQTTYVTYLKTSLSSVKDVDTAQAAAKVSQYQTQLQASYLAVAQISKVNLTQYL